MRQMPFIYHRILFPMFAIETGPVPSASLISRLEISV